MIAFLSKTLTVQLSFLRHFPVVRSSVRFLFVPLRSTLGLSILILPFDFV